ncbi:ABC transporter substrate-binding protein [Actinomycetospora endophytica]|uniref:ABC transporter substrate-binding protein n=1 Tax=Actinomycetospora endophytica TaxID=2291215 RepID=A0ABS8P7R0_9PSEU|nr:ABC transporter family substrate-binding protein [Actinomycetospora endophytica]MCD2194294.1 ABC transporter substrate-binding protein [Actinomycetospora endophytica]
MRLIAAGVLAVLALLAGCSTSPPPLVGQAPTPAPVKPQLEPDPTQLRIGVDDLGGGFNVHRIADLTPTSRTMAALVLPSAFRAAANGGRQLDTSVVTSAKVTSIAPYTVSYEIAPAAAWSDNAPIAAEDFVYLWQQMRSQPGVADAAGYRAISDVRSRAGGKAVDVVFDRPYPAWQTLFDNLLPAHLLKDAPGSWGGALQDSIPVSGGPYAVRLVDRIRGQVTLARNSVYWGTPPVPDQIVLQAADHASLIDRVRTGDVQATQFRADSSDLAALNALAAAPPGPAGPLAVKTVPEASEVQLALRSDDGPLSDPRVRRAVVSLLDRDALIASGTGGGPSAALRADAFATAPSEPNYRPTLPADSPAATPDPAEAARLLTAAGYVRGSDGRWSIDGRGLRLRLSAPAQASPYGRLLDTVAQELNAAGIGTTVVADSGANPFPPGRGPIPSSTASAPATPSTPGPLTSSALPGTTTTSPEPPSSTPTTTSESSGTTTSVPPTPKSASDMAVADLTVLALPVGGDAIADLDSVVGCPGRRAPTTSGSSPAVPRTTTASPATTTSAVAPAAPAPPTTTVAPTSTNPPMTTSGTPTPSASSSDGSTTSGAATTTPLDSVGTPETSEALSVTGFCDPALQSVLDGASSGAIGEDTALALAEPLLWRSTPVVPLFQASSTLVSPAGRTDVVVPPLGASPFASAGRWTPPARQAQANGDANN